MNAMAPTRCQRSGRTCAASGCLHRTGTWRPEAVAARPGRLYVPGMSASTRARGAAHERGAAVLLTGELVINAIRQEAGKLVTLAITCSCDQLRVVVHDTSRSLPVLVDVPADAETGRGLMLVAALSSQLGFLPHPRGQSCVLHAGVRARLPRGRRSPPTGVHTRGDGES